MMDHLQGHNKRQGSAHYTDQDIRVVCTVRSQPVLQGTYGPSLNAF